MATVTITGNTIRGATASKDNRTWQIRAIAYQYGGTGGGVITPGADWETLYPVDGVLTFTAESGSVVDIKTPDEVPYRVRIPTSNAGLWDVIEAGVAYQPDVSQDLLNRAVANAAPGFIAAELALQTADAIRAFLARLGITFTDEGEGRGFFSIFGGGIQVPISGTLVPPAATWSGVAGKPTRSTLEHGAVGDGVTDDTDAINEALAYAEANGYGTVILENDHLVSGTIVIPELITLQGRGGHASGARGTIITSSALSGPVIQLAGRSARAEAIRVLATTERRAASTTTGHGVLVGADDTEAITNQSRVSLVDMDIRDQPTDGVHCIGSMELGYFDTVTASDCVRHGFVMDGGTIAGYTNRVQPPFMFTMRQCRAIECGGAALLLLSTDGTGPQGFWCDKFDALGCNWDTSKQYGSATEKPFQVQIRGRGHIVNRIDVEDQQYANSTTATGGRTRTALEAPAKGVICLADGIQVNSPFFSSLSQSWYQFSGSNLTLLNPTINPGAYATQQDRAIEVTANVTGVDIRYDTTVTSGASTVVRNNSVDAHIVADGVPKLGLVTSTTDWGLGLAPVDTTIAGGILTIANRHVTVVGEGETTDSVTTMRLASGLNGYKGLEIYLFRGSQDITINHGTGNFRNAYGQNITMTSTANTVLHYAYDGTNWVQVGYDAGVTKDIVATAALNFGVLAAQSHEDLTITATGAVVGDPVVPVVPAEAETAGVMYTARVTAPNTVTVRAHNYSEATPNPTTGNFTVRVLK